MSRSFEPEADQVREARKFVSSQLCAWGIGDLDAPLLVSELATNAVLHARSDFTVTVSLTDQTVRVEVFDRNSRLPSFGTVSALAYSGRGLMLVQAMSESWGVDGHGEEGKTIWFEMAARKSSAADP